MLGNSETCEAVFEVLEDTEIKNEEVESLYDKLSSLVHQGLSERKDHNLTKNDVYLELFYLRVLQGVI